jgi:hypothetical protein
MTTDNIVTWTLCITFALAGMGLVFAKVDDDQVRKLELLDGFFATRLFRFRAFRYGAAVVLFIMAGVVYLVHIAPHAT